MLILQENSDPLGRTSFFPRTEKHKNQDYQHMKKNHYLFLMLLVLSLPFSSCNKKDEAPSATVVLDSDFNKGANGWKAVFAEYIVRDSVFYELSSGIRTLPNPLDQTKKGFMLSGNNHSDALQMFLTKKLTGLAPQTNYTIETEIELASMYPDGSVGIGGSPGNAVHLVSKFATSGYTLKQGKQEYDNIALVLNKVESVPESVLQMDMGDVSIPSETNVYQLISRQKASTPVVVKSDLQGNLWAIIGTWSGFEGISTLYYTKIKITLTKI